MHAMRIEAIGAVLVLVMAAAASAPAPVVAQTTVTAELLAQAGDDPGNWLMHSGQYHSQRFSRLDQITRANVGALKLKWVRQLPVLGQVQTTPLVVSTASCI